MASIFFWGGGEGHPLGTDTKNHNSKSNISFFFIYFEKQDKLILIFISMASIFFYFGGGGGGEKGTHLVLIPKIITLNQIFLFFYFWSFLKTQKKIDISIFGRG